MVQTIMALLMAMIDDRFNALAADVQRVERRQASHAERTSELELRLDRYEEQQWTAAKEAIEQFAAKQLPIKQRDELIASLYRLAADVEQLKQQHGE